MCFFVYKFYAILFSPSFIITIIIIIIFIKNDLIRYFLDLLYHSLILEMKCIYINISYFQTHTHKFQSSQTTNKKKEK